MTLPRPTRTLFLVALIAVLLAMLTALQYRWVAELSEFQRQQMERTSRASTNRFVRELDREFQDLWYAFRSRARRDAGEEIAEDYAEWAASFDFPELVASAYWITYESGPPGTDPAVADRFSIRQISVEDGRFDAVEWPPSLAVLRKALAETAQTHRRENFHESDSFTVMLGDQGLAFVVAQTDLDSKSWAVVMLRRGVLIEQFFPSLVQEHFGADEERRYNVRIFDEADEARVIYTSDPDASPAGAASPDLIRHLRDFGGFRRSRDDEGGRSLAVAVTHRAGSMEAAIGQLRRRNLGFSFGVVLVLGASIVALAVATRRAQRLAERQMEFVAGVSHELRTPIAGISSLSQNLADGVVQDLEQATQYGESIHQESRRLANMVEGVLHFSAIRSGRYRYEMRLVDLRTVVDKALEALDPAEIENLSLRVQT